MSLISTLLFTISANLDNIPIGIFFAINNNKLKIFDLIEISFFTSIFTFIIMLIGNIIAKILPIEFSNQIGAYIIIIIGVYGIIKEIFKKNKIQENNKTFISKFQTIILLSINNLALGINASITGINCLPSSIFTFIFSFIFLYIGSFIGKKINYNLISDISNYLSYIIILILGIIELI